MKRQKNSEFAYAKGREMRLAAEKESYETTRLSSMVPFQAPFFSHDATLQSFFNKGWSSVTACEVRLHLGIDKPESGADLLSQIRRFRECLSQSQR
ncbi:TPA: hypothetical protein L3320_001794 [Vibrio cholerae]|uniref:hypothetical protein n=1 Tax=Vibrio cholerae TaxID=666 RepID=UPI000D354B69|nr:hypothetical protein [Vibrio cholerae]HBN6946144.1 hypothetical protein [Vibrio cholerae]